MNTSTANSLRQLARLLFLFSLILPPSFCLAGEATDSPPAKRVLIHCPARGWNDIYLPWLMADPLLLADTAVTVDVKTIPREKCQPDLSAKTLAGYDLVIVTMPHDVAPGHFTDILQFLDRGGALFLFQPRCDSAEFTAALAQRTGMRLKGWSEAAAVSSVVAEHPGARILGLHRGRSAYPVYQTVGYSRQPAAGFAAVDAGGAAVLTRLTPGGEPDLAVSANGRFALFA
ncbi:MAG: hypothetical protein FJ388_16960, partial [Verrucomicrobia bacterium]|nr:hypothetical protein [Verrucomicrobiota bacterium]